MVQYPPMPARASSRIYNQAALEVWFENVALDWETFFSKEALQWGREIYLKGQISGVELADQDVIINCAFARKDTCYVVVEWGPKGPIVRCSTEDDAMGDAVAVGVGRRVRGQGIQSALPSRTGGEADRPWRML